MEPSHCSDRNSDRRIGTLESSGVSVLRGAHISHSGSRPIGARSESLALRANRRTGAEPGITGRCRIFPGLQISLRAQGLTAVRQRFIAESRAAAVDHPHIILRLRRRRGGRRAVHRDALCGGWGSAAGAVAGRAAAGPGSGVHLSGGLGAGCRASGVLVHRDVKPSNILVDASADRPDHMYLSDFGVSKGQFVGGVDRDRTVPRTRSVERRSRSRAGQWTGGPISTRWRAWPGSC